MTLFSWYVSNNGDKQVNNSANDINNSDGMWPIAKVRLNNPTSVKEVQDSKPVTKTLPILSLANKRYFNSL